MTEYQWGVRTEYADGSGGIEWSSEDEALTDEEWASLNANPTRAHGGLDG